MIGNKIKQIIIIKKKFLIFYNVTSSRLLSVAPTYLCTPVLRGKFDQVLKRHLTRDPVYCPVFLFLAESHFCWQTPPPMSNMGDVFSKRKETDKEKMEREAEIGLAKLAPEVLGIEQRFESLKRSFEAALEDKSMGKKRGEFQKEVKVINELGTLLLIKFDGIALHPNDSMNRQVRKGQIKRVQTVVDKKLKELGL
jgi:hypothetical protein